MKKKNYLAAVFHSKIIGPLTPNSKLTPPGKVYIFGIMGVKQLLRIHRNSLTNGNMHITIRLLNIALIVIFFYRNPNTKT